MFERPAHQRTPAYPSALWPTSHHHRSPRSTRLYKGKSGKSCDYVAKKPSKYCDSEDDDGTTAAEGCPFTCGNCGCQDSLTWRYKGKSSKDCDWVSKKPGEYCSKKSEGGVKAKEACRVSCETC